MNDMPYVEPGGFQKLIGYEITEWAAGYAVLTLGFDNNHANRHGSAHGGVMMTMLDAACTRAGAVCPDTGDIRAAATISMTTNFIRPGQGRLLKAVGRKTGGGRRIFFASAEIFDENDELLANAIATGRYA
jgi:uncharacterized protein (TIGR00369 family)